MSASVVATVVMLLVAGPAAAEWAMKPAASGSGCAVESTPESISDGYQTTRVRIRVDGKAVTVSSPSVFDGTFQDIGLAVDQHEFLSMDRLGDPRSVVFESRYADVVEQFKLGARVRLQLRFWPTWPTTGVHSVTVSLIGFTRAHTEFAVCK